MKRKMLALLMVSMMTIGLMGCGSGTAATATSAASGEAAQAAGSDASGSAQAGTSDLNVMLETPVESLDPQQATDGTSFEVIADYTDADGCRW